MGKSRAAADRPGFNPHLIGGEGAREACKNRKIYSGLKWAFGG